MNIESIRDVPSENRPRFLVERELIDWREFSLGSNQKISAHNRELNETQVSGDCVIKNEKHFIRTLFTTASDQHQLTINVPGVAGADGLAIRCRISAWDSIKYIAVGYLDNGTFRHVRVTNVLRDDWVYLSLSHHDLGYAIQNGWESIRPNSISDLQLLVIGKPHGGGAHIDLERVLIWKESEINALPGPNVCSRILNESWKSEIYRPFPDSVREVIFGYLKKAFHTSASQAVGFLENGRCPLYSRISLEWPPLSTLPVELSGNGTHRFSWHALHPATHLMVHFHNTGEIGALFAAREFVTNWIESSFFEEDPDKKYAWYDHGTAERLLSFVVMYSFGVEHRFDARFMARLRYVIIKHAQLLESEQFYASHQRTRYHNHAWYQDVCLIATALAFPEMASSNRWLETGITRLSDQFDKLIVRDSGFAVFAENSIGYHQGVQTLVQFAGALVALSDPDSPIPAVSTELSHFTEFLKYPDGRSPAQGDTYRRANEVRRRSSVSRPSPILGLRVLPTAGYAVMKGEHCGEHFMLSVFATSISKTHKHEDNLSFTLFLGDVEWLIDPSFYSHDYAAPIPAYLRSAFGHNNLAIVGREYTLGQEMVNIAGESRGDDFVIEGRHKAYHGTLIERTIKGKINAMDLEFRDCARSMDDGEVRLMLHCGESVNVQVVGSVATLSHPLSTRVLQIELPSSYISVSNNSISGDLVRGVSGLGFMNHSSINTIECTVPMNIELVWRIKAL